MARTDYMNGTAVGIAALDHAFNGAYIVPRVGIDKNLFDAFTAALDEAGVDTDAIYKLLADGEPGRVGGEE